MEGGRGGAGKDGGGRVHAGGDAAGGRQAREGLDGDGGVGGREAKGELTLEAVWVMKVEVELGLGLMEAEIANGTIGVESGEVKLG